MNFGKTEKGSAKKQIRKREEELNETVLGTSIIFKRQKMQCMIALISSVLLHFNMKPRLMVMSTACNQVTDWLHSQNLGSIIGSMLLQREFSTTLFLCSLLPEGLPYLLMTLNNFFHILVKHNLFHLHLRIVDGVIQSSTFPKRSTSASLFISYTSRTNQCTFWSSSVSKFRILFLKQSLHFQAIVKTNNAVVVLNRWANIFISMFWC